MKQSLLIVLISAAIFVWTGCSHTTTRTVSNVQEDQGSLTTPWAFDPGPSPEPNSMGKELIDIVASQPYMPGISMELTGKQKFRPAFGPTLWRMIQKENSIKILFIGQDGTHIAEAAGRTATAAFGGRAQDMAAHFGVETSAAFINAFAFTIKGQYSGYRAPYVIEENGKKSVSFKSSIVDNGIWLMAQDLNSPMVVWRNRLIDWIMRNNQKSLRLVVLFGDPAQDTIASFIVSHGGQVGTKFTAEDLAAKKIKVPIFMTEGAGGNKVVAVAADKNNKNIFETMQIRIPYKDLGIDASHERDPTKKAALLAKLKAAEAKLFEAQNALNKDIDKWYSEMAISHAGVGKSGLVHPAQIGGYDLKQIKINGANTVSLKGLVLSDGQKIENDVVVAEFPHPTSLSGNLDTANAKVEKSLIPLKEFSKKAGWMIEEDTGNKPSKYRANTPYDYDRADIGPAFYDFGTPKNRMVSVSSAVRMPNQPNIIIIGSREIAEFDKAKIDAANKAPRPDGISNDELFSARPRNVKDRVVFDMGPSNGMAKLMKENLDIAAIGKMKGGGTANPNCENPEPASQFNIKSHPLCVGDFGHYRGTFDNPKVVILADPDGVDDILTSRALTGTRGQYLQGMMSELGVGDKYLVIKTAPFAMDGATDEEWNAVLDQTSNYRKEIFSAIQKNGKPVLFIADGKYATQELSKIVTGNVAKLEIARSGTENNSGIVASSEKIAQLKLFNNSKLSGKSANIPRSHLGFFSRVWEGTSGSRVLDSSNAAEIGFTYAIIVPAWVYNQKDVVQRADERKGINLLKNTLETQGLPRENENFSDFLKRGGGRE